MEKLGLLLEPTISFNPGAPKLGKRVWVLALDWLLPVRKLEDPGFLTSPGRERRVKQTTETLGASGTKRVKSSWTPKSEHFVLECCSLSSGQFTQRLQSDWLQKEKDPGFVPEPTRFYVLLGMDESVFGGVLRLDLESSAWT